MNPIGRVFGAAVVAASLFAAAVLGRPQRPSGAVTPYADQLSGVWKNELGSVMRLRARDNALGGTYESAVGNATGAYNLTGSYVSPPPPPPADAGTVSKDGAALPVSFVVHFRNEQRDARSVGAWNGHVVGGGADGQPLRIRTTWLLTSVPAEPGALWASKRVGEDTFVKQK